MLCDYGCGQKALFHLKNGRWCCSKSPNKCPSIRRKLKQSKSSSRFKKKNSETQKLLQNKPEVKNKRSDSLKSAWLDPNVRKRIVDSQNTSSARKKHQEAWKNLEIREKILNSQIQAQNRPEVKKKNQEKMKNFWKNLLARKNHSDKLKASWAKKSTLEKEIIFSKVFKSSGIKPNKTEIFIDSEIQSIVPNEFKFVGDGQVWVGGKNPDWININGKKQVIEFFGNYWHGEERRRKYLNDLESDKEHELNRIEHYKKYGFNCLIIWENELQSLKTLREKVKEFFRKEKKYG